MKASFAGGVLHSTDYFSSRDRDEGRAWLVLSGCDWHVLLPRPPACALRVAHARPVTDCQELDGWRWRLELGGWHLPLPRRQILSPRPRLPEPYTCSERTLTLYCGETRATAGQSVDSTAPRRVGANAPDVPSVSKASKPSAFGFGSIQTGLQIHSTCRLWLVRDTRRGEKSHDAQRRLERFREQRPGD
jgi:hypothetical protein